LLINLCIAPLHASQRFLVYAAQHTFTVNTGVTACDTHHHLLLYMGAKNEARIISQTADCTMQCFRDIVIGSPCIVRQWKSNISWEESSCKSTNYSYHQVGMEVNLQTGNTKRVTVIVIIHQVF